jgi:hypothetical protein
MKNLPAKLAVIATISGAAIVTALARAPVPLDDYIFVPDTSRQIRLCRGDEQLFGRFDSEGNFIQEQKFPVTAELSSAPCGICLTFVGPGIEPIPVFEYRSGRLIPGVINDTGSFVPNLGGTTSSFKEYRCGPGVPPIWNLPGYFVSKKDRDRGLKDRAFYGFRLGEPK